MPDCRNPVLDWLVFNNDNRAIIKNPSIKSKNASLFKRLYGQPTRSPLVSGIPDMSQIPGGDPFQGRPVHDSRGTAVINGRDTLGLSLSDPYRRSTLTVRHEYHGTIGNKCHRLFTLNDPDRYNWYIFRREREFCLKQQLGSVFSREIFAKRLAARFTTKAGKRPQQTDHQKSKYGQHTRSKWHNQIHLNSTLMIIHDDSKSKHHGRSIVELFLCGVETQRGARGRPL